MKTKQELIHQVYTEGDISKKTVERVIQDFLNLLAHEVSQGNEVRIPELGIFRIVTRKAHVGHNPMTNQPIDIPERRLPQLRFTVGITRELNKDL